VDRAAPRGPEALVLPLGLEGPVVPEVREGLEVPVGLEDPLGLEDPVVPEAREGPLGLEFRE